MSKKKILVTGVGGNVGQGIIRNIRKSGYDVYVTGCNISSFSAGNHLCDSFHIVPYAYEPGYIEVIKEMVENEKIDLIIPATDYEVFFLAKNKDGIHAEVAVSDPDAAGTYLDKYLTHLHHQQYEIPFAETMLPSEYAGQLQDFIIKPRKGRGSRGLHINPDKWDGFSDDEYIVQRLYKGKELTTAFYIDKAKQLHGYITLLRILENGVTTQCKVVFDYDERIEPILKKIIHHTGIRGSANLQSIVTEDGEIFPFEINCRISGTNSIRSNFGFEDVKYTLQEYLFNEKPDKPSVTPGIAVRMLIDIIYPGKEDVSDCADNKSGFYTF